MLLDDLSAPALLLALSPVGQGLLDRSLRDHGAAGEPARVTLRQLVRHRPDWASLRAVAVAVCENPTVVAAVADRLGAVSPPLVCTDGQPSGAGQTLLRQLVDAGATLRFHADFDRGGIRLGNLLIDRFGARPWRMRTADHEQVAGSGRPLGAAPEPATWDDELAPAVIRARRAVQEEQVLDDLLADLVDW